MLKEYNTIFSELAKLPSILCVLSFSDLIHSLNKLPFELLPACLIFLPEKKFGLIAFNLGLIVLIKRGPLDPWWPFSKWITVRDVLNSPTYYTVKGAKIIGGKYFSLYIRMTFWAKHRSHSQSLKFSRNQNEKFPIIVNSKNISHYFSK